TGSTLLNYAISNNEKGGFPVGKISEVTGEEASGKSLMIAHALADTQRQGGIAVLLDTENAVNTDFLKRVGVDVDKLIYVQPHTIEEAFEVMEKIIVMTREKFPEKEKIVTVAWDSIAATPPEQELEGDYDPNSRIGVGAKTMSKGMRKITGMVGFEGVTLIFTNQLR